MRAALAVLVLLVTAVPAQAGQIVLASESEQIWAMKDDGSGAHRLVGNVPPLAMNDLREPAA